ncbi:hypothetical protein P3T76_009302 [Phytophthora citrophthora]|uniref:Uncharacterized protein n=1 Tax=Phytophthora citrophthora TaxID=4793 RepID=A0AAD9LJQ0_9STRA|nr:hypothetical protein P3T76_009302 [Phytophthora citrophthora]
MLDPNDKKTPLLPRIDPPIEFDVVPHDHSLLGLASVAVSALCFSILTMPIKYQTYSMTSMKAIFWRSTGAFVFKFGAIQLKLYKKTNVNISNMYFVLSGR